MLAAVVSVLAAAHIPAEAAAHRRLQPVPPPVAPPPPPGAAPRSFAKITEGTCEVHGFSDITEKEDCAQAATAYDYKVDWGPNGGFHDVVDGCSIRGNTQAFCNTAKTCVLGSSTPEWVPGANGKATCSCTEWQPCLCERSLWGSRWGSALLVVAALILIPYVGVGVAAGRRQGRGGQAAAAAAPLGLGALAAHPHFDKWKSIAALVQVRSLISYPHPPPTRLAKTC